MFMTILKLKKGAFAPIKTEEKSQEELTYIDPRDINPRDLPVGRISREETQTLTQMLRDLSSELSQATSKFPLEYLEVMQTLSLVNPDVSQMVDNIVQLGNTGHKVLIEAENDSQKDAILEELNGFQKVAFQKFGGVEGFVNSLLSQIARAGAGSVEWVIDEKFDGVNRAVFVPLQTVRFIQDPKTEDYRPYQKLNDITLGNNGYLELNTYSYQYCAIQLLDNSPYAVPPILAALEPLMIQRDIVKNFRMVAKKMGVLGLVSFLIGAPARIPGESDQAYSSRLQNHIDTQSEALKKNFQNGISVGYKGNLEVNVTSLAGNATGAKEIHQTIEELVFSGLKADPALHGRTYSTTETYAGVVYEKMLSMLTNYQRVAKQILTYGYQLHLTLKGFKYKDIYVEFESSKSLSSERDEVTYQQKLLNLEKLYDQGIISQDQYAQEAGYDAPDQEEPRVQRGGSLFPIDPEQDVPSEDPAEPDTTEESNELAYRSTSRVVKTKWGKDALESQNYTIRLTFDRKAGLYRLPPAKTKALVRVQNFNESLDDSSEFEDYSESDALFELEWGRSLTQASEMCGCGIEGKISLGLSESGKALKRYAASYFRSVYPTMKAARNSALKEVYEIIDKVDPQTMDSEEFAKILYNKLRDAFGDKIESSGLAEKIRKSVNSTYRYFRLLDAEPFGGEFPIKPSFEVVDKQAVKFMRSSDEFYFGKYVSDPETKKQLTKFIKDDYLKNGRNIRDPGELKAFKKRFGDRVAKEDYKVVRVVETSASRARNWGNALTSDQAKAKTLRIRGPKDDAACEWCLSMVGKEFKAKPVVNHIKDTMARDPEDLPQLNPFLVGKLSPGVADAMSTDQLLAQGISLPPYHPHCRHVFTVSSFED